MTKNKIKSKINYMKDVQENHLKHKMAVQYVIENLRGAISMDDVSGNRNKRYDVNWNGIKMVVKTAKPTLKSSQKRKKWFYSLPKDIETVDFFVLFAVTAEDKLGAVYVLPKVLMPSVFITITKLNGNVRYDYFKTDLQGLAEKIIRVNENLPRLVKLYKEGK